MCSIILIIFKFQVDLNKTSKPHEVKFQKQNTRVRYKKFYRTRLERRSSLRMEVLTKKIIWAIANAKVYIYYLVFGASW